MPASQEKRVAEIAILHWSSHCWAIMEICITSAVYLKFTTGDFDEPSFVKVNYWFQFNNETSLNEIWFWAKTQTYLFHPPGNFSVHISILW